MFPTCSLDSRDDSAGRSKRGQRIGARRFRTRLAGGILKPGIPGTFQRNCAVLFREALGDPSIGACRSIARIWTN
jgi:hypothetical protein